MAYIDYVAEDSIPEADRVPDRDHIIRVHGVHSRVMRLHYELYLQLMHRPGPLSRRLRETVALAVSGLNGCHY